MSESVDMILGKLLATITQIDQKIDRLVWRLDELEKRVEAMENDRAKEAPIRAWVERLFIAAGAAGAAYFIGPI